MNYHVKNIHITYGLPGSGKTYFCKKNMDAINKHDIYLDLDLYAKRESKIMGRPRKMEYWLPEILKSMLYGKIETVYIDGLCCTKKILNEIVGYLGEFLSDGTIIVHAWNEDRDTCIKNDSGRRAIDSIVSIQNMPYDALKSADDIKSAVCEEDAEKFKFRLVRHTVIEKPEWKQFFCNKGIMPSEDVKDDYIWYSSSWSLGGMSWNYTGEPYPIDADSETCIEELFDMFEQVDKKISLHMVRKLMKECVKIEEKLANDYYSSVTEARYVVDLKKMHQIIHE